MERTMDEVERLAKKMAESGMLGTTSTPECIAIIVMAGEVKMPLLQWTETYHIIKGKISMRADAMLSKFSSLGGIVKIRQRDPEGAAITLEYRGIKADFDCLWKDIQGEPFTQAHDKKTGKPVVASSYATPRKRMQMMWARCVSDGIRAMCPEVNAGHYTPEETQDFTSEDQVDPSEMKPARKTAKRAADVEIPPPPPAQPPQDESDSIPAPDNTSDVSLCPMKGKAFGRAWDTMPTKHLMAALTRDCPEMTDAHRAYIQDIIEGRERAEQDNMVAEATDPNA